MQGRAENNNSRLTWQRGQIASQYLRRFKALAWLSTSGQRADYFSLRREFRQLLARLFDSIILFSGNNRPFCIGFLKPIEDAFQLGQALINSLNLLHSVDSTDLAGTGVTPFMEMPWRLLDQQVDEKG